LLHLFTLLCEYILTARRYVPFPIQQRYTRIRLPRIKRAARCLKLLTADDTLQPIGITIYAFARKWEKKKERKRKKDCERKARLSAKHEPLSTGAKVIPAFTIDFSSLSLFLFLSFSLSLSFSFFSNGEAAQERAQQGSASVAVSRQTVSNRVVSRCLYVRGSELRGHRRRVTSAIKLRSIDVPFGARDGNVTVLRLLSSSRLPLQSYPRFFLETNYILFFFDYGGDPSLCRCRRGIQRLWESDNFGEGKLPFSCRRCFNIRRRRGGENPGRIYP